MSFCSLATRLTAVCVTASAAHAGVLLDYGYQPAFNDAGIVRGTGTPSGASGFSQFQAFTVTGDAWRLDSAGLRLALWDMFASGEAGIAVYAAMPGAGGTVPNLSAGPISETFALTVGSVQTRVVTVGLGGTVLERGTYYIGLTAADPLTDLAWLPGDAAARRHAVRADGEIFSMYSPALSLTLEGGVVPAAPTLPLLVLGAVGVARRRR